MIYVTDADAIGVKINNLEKEIKTLKKELKDLEYRMEQNNL